MVFPDGSKPAADLVDEQGGPRYSRRLIDKVRAARYSRRLSDKILAAFIHAYSLGQIDLADRLMESMHLCGEADGVERGGEALECAKSWVLFVRARNLYNEIKTSKGEESDDAHEALRTMKAAHRSVRGIADEFGIE